MSTISVNGSGMPTPLQELLASNQAIEPGSSPSYQLCKELYLYHPLGKKMTEGPISIAMSQKREITIADSPEERVREAFEQEWVKLGVDDNVAQIGTLARTYGVAAIVFGIPNIPTNEVIDLREIWDKPIYFNVLDPLNTSGSMVTNQDPNSPDFQKTQSITANSQAYHRSRSCVLMNERPVYIAYSGSAFGYVGRSVFQRALFPMKSFIQSMITDDLVTLKAGLLIAKLKQAGAIIDNIMSKASAFKRNLLKEGRTGNVLSISLEEDVSTLDMKNTDVAMTTARKNILNNIATGADMPAVMINSETFAEGFSDGTEDAKVVVRYVDHIRQWLLPVYQYFDRLVMYRAWNPEFIALMKQEFGQEFGYGSMSDDAIFLSWVNKFNAAWPSLLIEPESEAAKTEDVKLKALIELLSILAPMSDPKNKAAIIQWAVDNVNENRVMFQHMLDLDMESLLVYLEDQQTRLQSVADTQEEAEEEDSAKRRSGANLSKVA